MITEDDLSQVSIIRGSKVNPRKKRPQGFYNLVRKYLGNVRVSATTISLVKNGQRKNDAVLLAVIQADHQLQQVKDKNECLCELQLLKV